MSDSRSSHSPPDVQALRGRLARYGQEHLLRFWDELPLEGQTRLAHQVDSLDFDLVARLVAGSEAEVDFADLARRALPPPAVKADGTGAAWSPSDAYDRGQQAIRDGQVGAVIVAGGQGTRLGFEKPKGLFPLGPLSGRTLFQILADRLLAIGQYYGVRIPLYIMTSPATHDETIDYWQSHGMLGMDPDHVRVFCQGTMPAVERESGRILLADRDRLALSPDGHGGTVAALQRSGCLDDCDARGVRYLSYGQVDNPLVQLCDPGLVGHHLAAGSEMTTQVVRKRYPTEKVGNVVLVDGRLQIIEYSDLPESAATQLDDAGQLKLWAGSIAVHVFDVAFLRRMSGQADALPFHRAIKKVPYVDAGGNRVDPEQPNAVKFERFIFDLLPSAENAFVVEGIPAEVFAPVKNAPGAPADTADLAQQAMLDLDRRRLLEAGIATADGVRVEINPRFALDEDQLRQKAGERSPITADTYFAPDGPTTA